MRKSFLTKFAAVALVMGTIATALPAGAATFYCKQTIAGSGNTSKERIEGNDIELTATARSGWGTAFGRKYVPGGSDIRVAVASVDASGDGDPVTAIANGFDADGSLYYIHWSAGTSSSKGYVRYVGD